MQRSSRSHSTTDKASPLLGRNDAIQQVLKTYSLEFAQRRAEATDRYHHEVVYISGASGIGKSELAKKLKS